MGLVARQFERLRKLLKLAASGNLGELASAIRARRHGLDLGFVSVDDLGLSPEQAHFHSSSGGHECARLLKRIGIPRGSIAVDLGSGKGGAAITLSRFRFSEVIGVELSPELIRVAEENVRRLGLRNVRFIHADAGAFTGFDDVTHVYMYNPFPLAVLDRVLANISGSLVANDRELTIIYKNPVYGDAIIATGLFHRVLAWKPGDHWWHVYRHLPGAPAAVP